MKQFFKKIIILSALVCLVSSANAQPALQQLVTVHYKEQRLSTILTDLTKRFSLSFSYSNAEIPLEKKITLKLSKKPLSQVLDELTQQANLRWQQVGGQLILKSAGDKKSGDNKNESINLYQTIRGIVIDRESSILLPGVTVKILSLSARRVTSTNEKGEFRFTGVPPGRHEIEFSAMGYKKASLSQLLLNSGKELVLKVQLSESVTDLPDVVISANRNSGKSLNELASVSARSFSTEETSRYAASLFDPARMAQSFAGVISGNDLNNDIVIRGNSPKSLQWRLEGVEIINPNHFGEEGSSSGGISMISSSMLTHSDFFTGAFPAEYGNALSGVFDLHFRKGNTERREYAVMAGILGTEASLEGPFKSGSKSSYLINYRYSTLAVLEKIGLSPYGDGNVPVYQDLAFNLNFPTRSSGTFSLFGIGGISSQTNVAERDAGNWDEFDDKLDRKFDYYTGNAGLKHHLGIGSKAFITNILSYSGSRIEDTADTLTAQYQKNVYGRDSYQNEAFRYSGLLNYKASAKNTIRTGAIISYLKFNLSSLTYKKELGRLSRMLNARGDAYNSELYAQWKHRFNDKLSMNTGIHASYFNLSESFIPEPRVGLNWWMRPNQQISFGAGLHSRIEPMAFYFAKNELSDGSIASSNTELSPTRGMHMVLGYEQNFRSGLRIKAEAYYQYLYDVPVSADPGFNSSVLNTSNAYNIYSRNYRGLVNEGTGRNAGLEVTLERSLKDGYYLMLTSSIFDSRFKALSGKFFNTDYNSNYITNLAAGREWKTGPANKNLFAFNTRIVCAGGRHYSPINLERSLEEDHPIIFEDRINTLRAAPYIRPDISFSYRINKPKLTHAIFLDVQNVINRRNEYAQIYNSDKNQIEMETLGGAVPSIYYRIEF